MSAQEVAVADGTMTIDGAVEFTGLSRSTLYQLIKTKKLAAIKAGARGGRRLVSRAELCRLLATCVTEPAKS